MNTVLNLQSALRKKTQQVQNLLRRHWFDKIGTGLPIRFTSSKDLYFRKSEKGLYCESKSNDPYIVFDISRSKTSNGPAAAQLVFRVEVEYLSQTSSAPSIYVDRGQGFLEGQENRYFLSKGSKNEYWCIISESHTVNRIRFDPADSRCDFKILSLSLDYYDEYKDLNLLLVCANKSGTIYRPLSEKLMNVSQASNHAVITGITNLTLQDDLTLTSENSDPQINFFLDEGILPGTFYIIKCSAEVISGDVVSPQLFVSESGNHQEAFSFALDYDEKGSWSGYIVHPEKIKSFRWDPSASKIAIRSISISLHSLSSKNEIALLNKFDNDFRIQISKIANAGHAIEMSCAINRKLTGTPGNAAYKAWIKKYDTITLTDRKIMEDKLKSFSNNPKFSFVVPTYNTPPFLLKKCIDSMLRQTYSNFEICIADDNSTLEDTKEVLLHYASVDPRVKVVFRKINGHISAASNSAIDIAVGDYMVLVDHDDEIPDHALWVVAWYLNKFPNAAVLYSDEDKISPDGERTDPYFKGAFNRFLMYGQNMVSHLGVYDMRIVRDIDGFRIGYEGSQDYDLFLRVLDAVGEDRIVHIPHVLYHWRQIPGSTALAADEKSYAIEAAKKSINDHFSRNRYSFESVKGVAPGLTAVRSLPLSSHSLTSIIIPTRDRVDLLKACVNSVIRNSSGPFEIIIVDNRSVEPETHLFFDELKADSRVRVLKDGLEFNFSRINNFAAKHAKGGRLCFLNNDTVVISDNWLNRANAFLSIDEVGLVGAKLYYPSGKLQHFGLTLGMGTHGVAGTPHRGLEPHNFGYFGRAALLQEFSAVTAACMFVDRETFFAVDGFDEQLAVAYNDIDLCLKIISKKKKIVCDPEILLTHFESESRGADTSESNAGRLLSEEAFIKQKWGCAAFNDKYYSVNLSLASDDFSLAFPPRSSLPWREENIT